MPPQQCCSVQWCESLLVKHQELVEGYKYSMLSITSASAYLYQLGVTCTYQIVGHCDLHQHEQSKIIIQDNIHCTWFFRDSIDWVRVLSNEWFVTVSSVSTRVGDLTPDLNTVVGSECQTQYCVLSCCAWVNSEPWRKCSSLTLIRYSIPTRIWWWRLQR